MVLNVIAVREKHPADTAVSLQPAEQLLARCGQIDQNAAAGQLDEVRERADIPPRGVSQRPDVVLKASGPLLPWVSQLSCGNIFCGFFESDRSERACCHSSPRREVF